MFASNFNKMRRIKYTAHILPTTPNTYSFTEQNLVNLIIINLCKKNIVESGELEREKGTEG